MFTKQYAALYILLGVLMFAISSFTAVALREANTTYDLQALQDSQQALTQQIVNQVNAQEQATADWIDQANCQVQAVSAQLAAQNAYGTCLAACPSAVVDPPAYTLCSDTCEAEMDAAIAAIPAC